MKVESTKMAHGICWVLIWCSLRCRSLSLTCYCVSFCTLERLLPLVIWAGLMKYSISLICQTWLTFSICLILIRSTCVVLLYVLMYESRHVLNWRFTKRRLHEKNYSACSPSWHGWGFKLNLSVSMCIVAGSMVFEDFVHVLMPV